MKSKHVAKSNKRVFELTNKRVFELTAMGMLCVTEWKIKYKCEQRQKMKVMQKEIDAYLKAILKGGVGKRWQ